ncbi:PKD domain-containing protein [uncultured Desulfosarcina sp.]|uniref:PKD domain-containing protein n=1 Tax=uncultured Desulfosarcina sp. TaxID=218289 RepID=UPI0029C8CB62|nr:PKD domain-containing protein [uncultured Desulfosarcina sp.]
MKFMRIAKLLLLLILAAIPGLIPPAGADDFNYVQRLVSYEDLHASPAWTLTQWTGNAATLEDAVVGAPDYDPATTAGDALGWQQGYGNYVLDFGYAFTGDMTFWHFGGTDWSGVANNLVFMRVSSDGETWSDEVQLRDVTPGGGEVFEDTYLLTDFGVASARYLRIEKKSGGAKTGKFIDAVGVAPESGGENQPPSAYAGADISADPGDEVVLDASGSSDPDGQEDLYAYQWEQTEGRDVGLAAVNTSAPYFYVPADAAHGETFTFRLTVTDRSGLSDTDEVTVTAITRHPPVADAGRDQRVKYGSVVTLDASGSSDPDDDITDYLWEQTDGTAVSFEDPTAVATTFTAPNEAGQTLVFRLTVTDATGLTGQGEVQITTVDYSPVYASQVYDEEGAKNWVSRSPDRAENALGAPDYDPDNPGNQASGWDSNSGCMILLFKQAFITGDGQDLAIHNFGPGEVSVAVSVDGVTWTSLGNLPVGTAGGETLNTHKFDLDEYEIPGDPLQFVMIEKAEGGANTGRFIDAVEAYFAMEPANNNPAAVIFADGNVDPGSLVALDGTRSFDPDGDLATYAWHQTQGPDVSITDSGQATAYFNVPANTPHGTILEFCLTVGDSYGNIGTETAALTVMTNHEPVADAGSDQKIMAGKRVRLDGSGSYDPDEGDGIVQYQWEQLEGEALAFDDQAQRPLLTLPDDAAGQTLVFQLTVTDGGGLTDTDQVKLTVVDYDPAFADSVMDQYGCKSWATREADGAVNALGAPDYDREADGDQLSGWNYNNGFMALEFRKNIVNGSGADFCIYHFGPGAAEVYVGSDGSQWAGPVVLPPTAGGGGDYYTHSDFDLDDFGVSTAKFVRIVQTQSGPKTGRFIDAVEAFSMESGPDSLTVVEGSTCRAGRGATEINLIDTENDQWEWREADDSQALSDPGALTPTFVAPPVAESSTRDLNFNLFLNGDADPHYQIRYTIKDNSVSDAYLPDGAMPMETATEKRIGIVHDGTLVRLDLLSDSDPAIPELPGKPRNFIYGLIDVAQRVDKAGGQAALTIAFTTPLSTDYGWFAFNEQDGWFAFERSENDTVDGVALSSDRSQATLYVTDGGGFDDDGEVNGVVYTVTGPALAGSQDEWLDKGGGEGGCFIRVLLPWSGRQ